MIGLYLIIAYIVVACISFSNILYCNGFLAKQYDTNTNISVKEAFSLKVVLVKVYIYDFNQTTIGATKHKIDRELKWTLSIANDFRVPLVPFTILALRCAFFFFCVYLYMRKSSWSTAKTRLRRYLEICRQNRRRDLMGRTKFKYKAWKRRMVKYKTEQKPLWIFQKRIWILLWQNIFNRIWTISFHALFDDLLADLFRAVISLALGFFHISCLLFYKLILFSYIALYTILCQYLCIVRIFWGLPAMIGLEDYVQRSLGIRMSPHHIMSSLCRYKVLFKMFPLNDKGQFRVRIPPVINVKKENCLHCANLGQTKRRSKRADAYSRCAGINKFTNVDSLFKKAKPDERPVFRLPYIDLRKLGVLGRLMLKLIELPICYMIPPVQTPVQSYTAPVQSCTPMSINSTSPHFNQQYCGSCSPIQERPFLKRGSGVKRNFNGNLKGNKYSVSSLLPTRSATKTANGDGNSVPNMIQSNLDEQELIKNLTNHKSKCNSPNCCVLSFENIQIIRNCQQYVMENFDANTILPFLGTIVAECCERLDSDRFQYKFKVGRYVRRPDNPFGSQAMPQIYVCKDLFCIVYGISSYRLESLQAEYKTGMVGGESTRGFRAYNDHTKVPPEIASDLRSELDLDGDELIGMSVENTHRQLRLIAWMENFFHLVGDCIPNTGGEIHLESQEMKEIFNEYRDYIINDPTEFQEPLQYNAFIKSWAKNFPHVLIRKYKAVTGKCHDCAILTGLRYKFRNPQIRNDISKLHAWHRIFYMNERMEYYRRCELAIQEPEKYMSIILDGMSQDHNTLPWLANLKEFPSTLDMHLQGVIEHGQSFTLYRTYANVAADTNLAIFCIANSIQQRIERKQVLPQTLFIQIDGGAENSNQYVLAFCEYLIAVKAFERVHLTRLPVGHTHEDIDSMFGRIWKTIRNIAVHSEQEYRIQLYKTFSVVVGVSFHLKDVFVCPDYRKWFEKVVDPQLGGYAKQELTQLAWRFQKVERSLFYPLGVKTEYRATSSDIIHEIVADTSIASVTGYRCEKAESSWGPVQNKIYNNMTTAPGTALLKSLPLKSLEPAEFIKDHYSKFEKCYSNILKPEWFGTPFYKHVIDDWEAFSAIYPSQASVFEYLECNPEQSFIPLIHYSFFDIIKDRHYDEVSPNTPSPVFRAKETVVATVMNKIATFCVWTSNFGNPQYWNPPRLHIPEGADPNHPDTLYHIRELYLSNLIPSTLYDKTIPELQAFCRQRSIPYSGFTHSELVQKLMEHHKAANPGYVETFLYESLSDNELTAILLAITGKVETSKRVVMLAIIKRNKLKDEEVQDILAKERDRLALLPASTDYPNMTTRQLKNILLDRGLSRGGNKADLITRIVANDQKIREQEEKDDDDNDDAVELEFVDCSES